MILLLAIIGLFSIATGFVLNMVVTELKAYALILIGIGVILIIAAVVIDYQRIKKAVGTRRGKLGISLSVRIISICAIVILANAISYNTFKRYDLTGVSQFTLTSQTKEMLNEIDEPVRVVGFFSSNTSATVISYAQSLLEEYQVYSDQVSVTFVDPDLNPDIVRTYNLESAETYYGVLVVRGTEGEKRIYGPQIEEAAEYAITSAVMEVSGNKQKTVYFTYGHNERISDEVISALQDSLFAVNEVDITAEGAVPENTDLLIISAPESDFTADEITAVNAFLSDGGRALVMINPGYDGGLSGLLSEWSIRIGDGIIVDPESFVVPRMNVLLVDGDRNIFSLDKLFFPDAAAIIPMDNAPEGRMLIPMAWSSSGGWLDTDESKAEAFTYNEETDLEGTYAIGMLEYDETDETGRRLAVIGDSDFVSSSNFLNGDNANFLILTISWLTEGKEVVDLERNVMPYRRLIINSEQARFMMITSIGLIPVLLIICAIYVWWRKR